MSYSSTPTMLPPPLYVGTPTADQSNRGAVVCQQTVTLTQNSTNVVTAQITVTKGLILDILFDTTTAWNSGTSATGSVGTSAGGTQYASGVSTTAAARVRPTLTAAQMTAFALAADTNVFISITPVGATSAGVTRVTIIYATTV